MRVGLGYDVHAFDPARPLILGGVIIEGTPGLAGWSDADVVSHAIVDALLGAARLGDLGTHFNQTSVPEGSSSMEMLTATARMLAVAGYRIVNIDTVVVIEEVKVAPYRQLIVDRIAGALELDPSQVSVKATTTDRLGLTGRGEGAAGIAVALLEEMTG